MGQGHKGEAPDEAPDEDTPAGDGGQYDLLMGFLAEFHAALRQPDEPPGGPSELQPVDRAHLPNRLAAIVPVERDLPDYLLDPDAQVTLPTWPPAPDPARVGDDPPPADPAPEAPIPEAPTRPKGVRLRRLGRRG